MGYFSMITSLKSREDRPLSPEERRALVEKPLPTFYLGKAKSFGGARYSGGIPINGRQVRTYTSATEDESYLRVGAGEEVEEWD